MSDFEIEVIGSGPPRKPGGSRRRLFSRLARALLIRCRKYVDKIPKIRFRGQRTPSIR